MSGKPWTDRELAFVRKHYKRDMTAQEIADQLGRGVSGIHQRASVLGLDKKKPMLSRSKRLHRFIRTRNARGWSDSEIAKDWNGRHPDTPLDRRYVCAIRRHKLRLPHNAYSERRRKKVAAKTRQQLKDAGVPTLGHLRAKRYREFAVERGWPAGLRPREVQILDILYERGPQTRRSLQLALYGERGLRKHQRNWLGHTTPNDKTTRGSYVANLLHAGLIVRLGKCIRTGRGKGTCAYLYAIPPTIKRGEPWTFPEAARAEPAMATRKAATVSSSRK